MTHQTEAEPNNDYDMDQALNRRMFLKAASILAVGAVAGCMPQAESGETVAPSTVSTEAPANVPPPTIAQTQAPPTLPPTQTLPPTEMPPTPAPTQALPAPEIPLYMPGTIGTPAEYTGHYITALCLRDSACTEVCPVEAIVGGKPEEKWPWYMIDRDTCIDCGACVPECPYEAIFDAVPPAYTMREGQYLVDTKERLPQGNPLDTEFGGRHVTVANAWAPGEGYVVDLTTGIEINEKFFREGPGYAARG